ncbi:hypothetical protein B0I00_2268 [Novosphingobium kunmingense]|uniref:Uncharacterized protein n=1 Tax=Novosphingobium kunmingense TaxID=1211806 RepID=A0A2N0H707_9SPHN|nr:hypothetical protein [Novosphingobium kunmingense]PKB14670.1 hypothetical protein B0I00_2268 [Novosphingobium kunmingense]
MITYNQTAMPRFVLAAGLALLGTVASFGVTTTPARAGTSTNAATLATGLESPAKKVVNGALWKCTGDACVGQIDGSRPVNTCRQVVKTFGAVTKFATPKGELSAEDLQRCNAAA